MDALGRIQIQSADTNPPDSIDKHLPAGSHRNGMVRKRDFSHGRMIAVFEPGGNFRGIDIQVV